MLHQASLAQLRKGEVTRKQGTVVIAMAHYPRGVRTELRDEFLSELAPDRPLLHDWKNVERRSGHEEAFRSTRYESRFRLSAWGLHLLGEFAARAQTEEIYLVCQCEVGERCHREMLMLLAHEKMGAPITALHNEYPTWAERAAHVAWPLLESALATGERKFPP